MKQTFTALSLILSVTCFSQDTSRTTQVIPLSSLDTLIQSIVTVNQTITSSYLEQSVRKYKPPVPNQPPVAKAGADQSIKTERLEGTHGQEYPAQLLLLLLISSVLLLACQILYRELTLSG
jgi:hypothetical protein